MLEALVCQNYLQKEKRPSDQSEHYKEKQRRKEEKTNILRGSCPDWLCTDPVLTLAVLSWLNEQKPPAPPDPLLTLLLHLADAAAP